MLHKLGFAKRWKVEYDCGLFTEKNNGDVVEMQYWLAFTLQCEFYLCRVEHLFLQSWLLTCYQMPVPITL